MSSIASIMNPHNVAPRKRRACQEVTVGEDVKTAKLLAELYDTIMTPAETPKTPPISPEKAPLRLKLDRSTKNENLQKTVRRALFAKKAKETYLDLHSRDLQNAFANPEQKDAYLQRSNQYHKQWMECVFAESRLSSKIQEHLTYDAFNNPLSKKGNSYGSSS